MDFEYIAKTLNLPIEKVMNLTEDEITLLMLVIGKLKERFKKIDFDEYYLSYSGGKDSHLLYWFIKEFLKDDRIKIVGVNTYREHNEIRKRIYDNCDIVLYPTMKMNDINEKYGMPCFTKHQDEMIMRWQNGSRSDYLNSRIMGYDGKYSISKKARTLLLDNKLPKVSSKCCDHTKKKPFKVYEKESGRKAILGLRRAESIIREGKIHNCLGKNLKFTPLFDLTNEMIDLIYHTYTIHIPYIYHTYTIHIPICIENRLHRM